jgi:hypothetical protein
MVKGAKRQTRAKANRSADLHQRGQWLTSNRIVTVHSWLRTEILANDLPYGDHICILEMVYGDSGNCTSACLEIGLIADLSGLAQARKKHFQTYLFKTNLFKPTCLLLQQSHEYDILSS